MVYVYSKQGLHDTITGVQDSQTLVGWPVSVRQKIRWAYSRLDSYYNARILLAPIMQLGKWLEFDKRTVVSADAKPFTRIFYRRGAQGIVLLQGIDSLRGGCECQANLSAFPALPQISPLCLDWQQHHGGTCPPHCSTQYPDGV